MCDFFSWKADPAVQVQVFAKKKKSNCAPAISSEAALHHLTAKYCSFVRIILIFEDTQSELGVEQVQLFVS